MKGIWSVGVSFVAIAAGFAWCEPAVAQEVEGGAVNVEEVIVTARRREERLQDVPITVSVVGQEQMERLGVDQVSDLTAAVPNVNLNASTQFRNAMQPVIRGTGQGDIEQSFEPATAVYIDGVYQGRSDLANVGVWDVEQVEVLKGPQGTLFGRNTTAGAINITTHRPGPVFGGRIAVTKGDFGRFDIRGLVDIPLIDDRLLLNLSYSRKTSEGYWTDVGPVFQGRHWGGLSPEEVVKAKLLWRPSENVDVLLIADHFSADASPAMGINSTGLLGFGGIYANSNWDQVSTDYASINNYEGSGLNATVNWRLGDFTLTSITAGRKAQDFITHDIDGTPLTVYHNSRTQSSHQFSQELRLASPATERFNYVVGLFYYQGSYEIRPRGVINFTAPSGTAPIFNTQYAQQDSVSYAAFGEGSFNVTDTIRVFGGLRWTVDQKEFDRSQTNVRLGAVISTFATPRLSGEWSSPSYRLGVDWKPSDDLLLFASYARGYKGGGFQGRANTITASMTPFNPEYSDAFELGWKSDLWDRRVRLNGAVFYAIDTDLQTQLLKVAPGGGTDSTVINAGELNRYGIELEGLAQVTPNFRITANAGYTKAEYTEFFAPLLTTTPQDYTYLKPRFAPEYSANLGLEYVLPTSWGEFFVGSNTSYRSDYYNDVANFEVAKSPEHTETSLHFGAGWDGGWELTAVVNNLFDQRYFQAITYIANQWTYAYPNDPRNVRVTLSYEF